MWFRSLIEGWPGGFVMAAALLIAAPAQAAGQAPLPCGLGMVEGSPVRHAALRRTDVPAGKVRVTFVGHSTFFIETPGGATAATDYNGFLPTPSVPQIVTMNNSHSGHFTDTPDPGIRHVLRGWDPNGKMARHHLRHRDLRVYNLPTNIFNFGDQPANGNSVFVFDAAGLCLAHLGHLHHFLSKEQVANLGRIDVLFVPIDGIYTISHQEALHIIGQIRPRVIIADAHVRLRARRKNFQPWSGTAIRSNNSAGTLSISPAPTCRPPPRSGF